MNNAAKVRRYAVADVDTHIVEPADLWTSRIGRGTNNQLPHVRYDEKANEDRWYLGGRPISGFGSYATAGWSEHSPKHPAVLDEIDVAAWDPVARLRHMDENGIYYQLLYGNLLGFHAHAFLQELGEEVSSACVSAYNDYLSDFASADPKRLIPIAMIPFWDPKDTVREIERVAALGHRGICIAGNYEDIGFPALRDEYWDPMFRAAIESGLSVNFHVGFGLNRDRLMKAFKVASTIQFVKDSSLFLMSNANTVAEVVLGGVCDRYPELDFVSVENGAGWLPYFAETMDWQWCNSGAHLEYRERLMPSEYVRRQVYGMFWFESATLHRALELYPDNIMFETDFPHPTSLSPGPASTSPLPADVIVDQMASVSSEVVQKVMHGTAARVYRLDVPDPNWVTDQTRGESTAQG